MDSGVMKNILIIGGSYFVGRVFVEELAGAGGYAIYVLNRGNAPLAMPGIHEIVCDRRDYEALEESVPSLMWDAVVDFCAYTPGDIEIMFSILPETSVNHYIYISTASVYQQVKEFPVTEDMPKLSGPQKYPGPLADYAYHKWLLELELESRCRGRHVHYTSFRPAFIYGKYNYAPRESYFFDLMERDEPLIVPEPDLALFSFVSVWDVARVIIASLGNEKVWGRAFNLAAEELVSYGRLIEVFEIVSEKKLLTRSMPVRRIDEERIPLPFPIDKHLIYSGEAIRETLGFNYTPFVEGMRMTYEHCRRSHNPGH